MEFMVDVTGAEVILFCFGIFLIWLGFCIQKRVGKQDYRKPMATRR
jgi:hypothetical protein